jgi:hypothetical protein
MNPTKLYARLVLLFIPNVLLVLMGCGISPETLLPTRTPTATRLICPELIINTPQALRNSPIVVITLIEQQFDTSEWTETFNSFQILNQVVPSIAQPEDRLIMFYLGPRVYDDALISDEIVGSLELVKPSIPFTPTSFPTGIATVTPATTPDDKIVQIATERSADATQTSVIATTTQNAFLDQCAKVVWATSYAAVATQWAVTKAAAINAFTIKIQVTKTPGESGESHQNEVYEGFSHATRKFIEHGCIKQAETDQNATLVNSPYSRCILLVFSNMDEWRPPTFVKEKMPALHLSIDLNAIEVAVVMLNCNDLSENYCLGQKEFWTEELKDYGAASVDFFSKKDIEYHLRAFLERR